MDTAADILGRLLPGYDLDQITVSVRVEQRWTEVVGDTVAAHSRPDGVRGATLSVVVDSAAWLQQLQFYRDRIIANLRDRSITVKNVRFRVGSLHAGPPERPAPRPRTLGPEEVRRIKEWCSTIEDQRLRDHLEHLIRTALAEER